LGRVCALSLVIIMLPFISGSAVITGGVYLMIKASFSFVLTGGMALLGCLAAFPLIGKKGAALIG